MRTLRYFIHAIETYREYRGYGFGHRQAFNIALFVLEGRKDCG